MEVTSKRQDASLSVLCLLLSNLLMPPSRHRIRTTNDHGLDDYDVKTGLYVKTFDISPSRNVSLVS